MLELEESFSAPLRKLKVLLADTQMAPYADTAPASVLSTFNGAVLGQLIKINSNFELIPGLLESWQWDYQTSEYVLKLRSGLRFHNGREVKAKDLEFSLLRGFFSKNQSFYRTYLSNVQGVEKVTAGTAFKSGLVSGVRIVSEDTLRVKLSIPNPSFLLGLTGPYFSIVPIEEFESDQMTWKSVPIGAGPYRVVQSFNNGCTKLKLVNKPEKGQASEIDIYTTYKKELFDISIYPLDPDDVKKYKLFVSRYAASILNLAFSNLRPDSSEKEFRKLISYIVNKEELLSGMEGYLPAEEMLPRHLWGHSDLPTTHNLDLAKKILRDSFPHLKKTGLKVAVFSGPRPNLFRQELIRRLATQLEKFGLTLTVESSTNKFTTKAEAEKFHLFFSGMVADYHDPLVMFASLTQRGADQYTRPKHDEQLEELYIKASESVQRENRTENLRRLSSYVREQVYVLPLAEEHRRVYFNPTTVVSVGEQVQAMLLSFEQVEMR